MPKTIRLSIDPAALESPLSSAAIAEAAAILRSGGTVAFPTETVYGVGANALDAVAVAKIFEAKQRPSWDPLIVHVTDQSMVRQVSSYLPDKARRLMDIFWPGPLTLLLPRAAGIGDIVTAGRPLVGVRMPAHPVALALVRAAGVPVAAPSANRFGRTSPTLAAHVAEDLDGRIDAILDAGETQHGVESTVVDVCEEPCVIYRPGVITIEQVRAVCTGAVVFQEKQRPGNVPPESLPSPGVGLRHYAPKARLVLVAAQGEGATYGHAESQQQQQIDAFRTAAMDVAANGMKLGLMLPDSFQQAVWGIEATIFPWGRWSEPEELAQRLFAGLRELDSAEVEVIICPMPASRGIGMAIRDRLEKAARSE